MPTTLITGANRGLGLEFARQYAADGWRVIACARNPAQATALKALGGNVEVRAIDVADFAAIDRLAKDLAGTAIDHLIMNAGLNPQGEAPLATETDYDAWPDVFKVNTMAPLRMAVAFADHVAASDRKVIAAVSSGGGSISQARGGNYIYRSSKAALNSCMKGLSREYESRGLIIVMIAPGWVRTEMGGPNAPLSAEQSITGVRKALAGLTAKDNGRFIKNDGSDCPW
ncbi:MAG: short-chain dehydrogenase/reductase [Rhodospirillales bacterium]|nr:short-chain dehydrogenase/reductase [Rhodospirillales bacterium]